MVTCSAGNDATARPQFPAAFAPWQNGQGPVAPAPDCVPVVSVGALNPNSTLTDDPDEQTVALFSNTGPWVRSYVNGAAVMSTMPAFQGGLQPMARTHAFGRRRESIDPDDFRGQFAVWSGTSFSAPLQAGRIAALLLDSMPEKEETPSVSAAVQRGWAAVTAVTGITPS